jgi:hypothetical protein
MRYQRGRAPARSCRPAVRLGVSLLAVCLAALGVRPVPSVADSWPADPTNPRTPPTAAIDRLPTVQINGVAWNQVVHAPTNTVYVVGKFTTARPAGAAPGTQTVTRNNILAYDLTTGALRSGFTASLNAQALGVAISPDGTRLYVVGDFTSVNGVARSRIAALNPRTGALIPSFTARANGSVRAVVADNSSVWVGGNFTSIGTVARGALARLRASDGAALAWAGRAGSGRVNALALSPDSQKLVVGGAFTTLNGSSRPGYGLGALNANTGALVVPFQANDVVRNAGTDSAILSLASDGTGFFGTGYLYGTGGNLEGAFSANWSDNRIRWVEDCHGDSYGVYPSPTAVYVAGHPHYCLNLGGYPEMPSSTAQRAIAFSPSATGFLTKDTRGYPSFTGQPAPTLLNFFPQLDQGSVSGQSQAAWAVDGAGDYVVFAGEFRHVNGTGQQGLVRLARRNLAPNKQGPKATGTSFSPTASSPASGQVRLAWTANFDYDNTDLTYSVLRDTLADPVATLRRGSTWWNRPAMSYTDSGVSGGTHTYRVRAADRFGNAVTSPPVSITVAGPANAAPTARFTSAPVGRTLDVDASGSTDADGTVASYTWSWGDGTSGTGRTARHLYTADGSYVVRLTVTDDDGATGTTSRTVVVAAPAVVAKDAFNRTVASGLGSADTGGPWSLVGSAKRFTVNGAQGVVGVAGPASGPSAYLPGTSATSVDVTTGVRLDKLANGGGAFFGTIGRKVGAAEYRMKVRVAADGAVTAYVTRVSGAETTLRSVVVPGLRYAAGKRLNTRLQVAGTSPTTVRARVWLSTATEPTAWQVSATDSTAGLQGPGSVGLHTFVPGTATNAPWPIRFDDFLAVPR